MMMSLMRFWRDEVGGALVEAAVVIPIFIVFALGSVDMLYAYYQWTAATKAVQVGARLAAVSDPVASGLNTIPTSAVGNLGDPMPAFEVTCASGICSCTGACTTMGSYSATAMDTIIKGRGSDACGDATSLYSVGMCDIFPSITAANVRIVYSQTGLGYVGRVAGPVPTITVSLQGLTFQYFFLNVLPGFPSFTMPSFATTITGEGLSSGPVS
jgi:Flp pilus assembly protein TadG